jgi:crotonobetainyl-CoA:carnitine CoA-transferase CaiB-like acyl-CoA transferase
MDSLKLGSGPGKIKPDIIMAAVTTYGQNGPKAHYKGDDLTPGQPEATDICGDDDTPRVDQLPAGRTLRRIGSGHRHYDSLMAPRQTGEGRL